MFVGHYGPAFVGKAVAPRVPLWVLLIAAQLVDVAWAIFVVLGVERVSFDPSLPSNPLVLEYMPFTHSLAGAIAWGLVAALAVTAIPRLGGSARGALVAAAVVVSHWVLDLLVHRPDLTLAGGEHRLGLGLWNLPLVAFVAEIALLVASAAYYASRPGVEATERRAIGRGVAMLVGLQIVTLVGPIPPSTSALAVTMLATFVLLAWAAARAERRIAG